MPPDHYRKYIWEIRNFTVQAIKGYCHDTTSLRRLWFEDRADNGKYLPFDLHELLLPEHGLSDLRIQFVA